MMGNRAEMSWGTREGRGPFSLGCDMTKDTTLYNLGKNAVMTLAKNRQRGSYRVIRDPDGVISVWSIEGEEHNPLRMSFANKGRVSGNIEDMPPEFVKAFVEYVQRTVLKK